MKTIDSSRRMMTGILSAVFCETLFCLSYVFTRHAVETVSPLALLAWRFTTAFAFMSVLAGAGLIKLSLKGKAIRQLFPIAIFNPVIYFLSESFGIRFSSAAESGAFLACIPAASLVCARLILRKKPEKTQSAGIALTLAGVLVTLFNAGLSVHFSARGYTILCAAVVSYALYSVYTEKAVSFSGAEITFAMLAAGAAVFTAAALIEAVVQHSVSHVLVLPLENPAFLAAVLYQGLGCSALAFFPVKYGNRASWRKRSGIVYRRFDRRLDSCRRICPQRTLFHSAQSRNRTHPYRYLHCKLDFFTKSAYKGSV